MREFASTAACFLLLICSSPTPCRACTSFCLDTPDGPVFGTNLDLSTGDGHLFVNRRGIEKTGYRASTTGETAEWVSRYGSVTFNLVGRELPWGGMNEAGVTISTMQLNASICPEADERPPLSEASLVQYVLDTCGSVGEVVESISFLRLSRNECTSHYLVADESGECATIEFLDGRFVCHTGETLPIKALANAPYAAGIAFIENGFIPADNPGDSVERVASAADKINGYRPNHGASPVDYVLAVLTETVAAPRKWWSNLLGEPYTRWNIAFDLGRREVHYRTVTNPAVRRLSLDSFDFSCQAPLLMLDVNAELEGSIDGHFGPYDHDVNLEIFRTGCKKLGIDVSEESAAALTQLFETFACAPDAR